MLELKWKKMFALQDKAEWADAQENQHYSQIVAFVINLEIVAYRKCVLFLHVLLLLVWNILWLQATRNKECNISISYQLKKLYGEVM